jgi:hypothetical protein
MRQYVERQIIAAFVNSCLSKGHNISVNDGGETTVWNSTNPTEIMKALQTTDEDHLYVDAKRNANGDLVGSLGEVVCVYGNEGNTVISDYHTSLEPLMKDANELADWWDGDGSWVTPPFETRWVGPGVVA